MGVIKTITRVQIVLGQKYVSAFVFRMSRVKISAWKLTITTKLSNVKSKSQPVTSRGNDHVLLYTCKFVIH